MTKTVKLVASRANAQAMPDITLCRVSTSYKPIVYPWAVNFMKIQQQIQWIPEEIPLGGDVKDYAELPGPERALIDNILRVFTQSDIDVTENYMTMYQKIFRNTQIAGMLQWFGAEEFLHVQAYALLLDTLGKDDTYFNSFLDIEEMRAKHDLMRGYRMDNPEDVAITLALAGGFGEGLQLFSQFAMLMNFKRFGKMLGMGQIVTWSIRDETLHVHGLIKLFDTFLSETGIKREILRERIEEGARKVVMIEDAFIDRAFEMGAVRGMTPQDMKNYIRYTADYRMAQLGYPPIYGIKAHPLPWLESILNAPEFSNFFEQRSTDYSKGTLKGDWKDVFEEFDRREAVRRERKAKEVEMVAA